jgi:cell division septation protein DedD
MSSMETINEGMQPNPETPVDSAQKQAKRVFIGFAATVTVGLALAGWYVGGKIFAAERTHPVAVAIAKPLPEAPPSALPALTAEPAKVVIAEPVAVQAVEAEKPKPADTLAWDNVTPQPGDLYLQLATMGPNSTNEYLKVLDSKGIHPKIAPGPSESLHRLVIGPYPDKAALEKEQRELEAAGIQFMARRY